MRPGCSSAGRSITQGNTTKHTTTDCGNCGARAKHRLPLSQRTYRCEHCGHVAPRDKNSAHVIHNRAGFNPAGADGLLIEIHPTPKEAWCDADQALTPDEFAALFRQLDAVARAVGREL